MLPLLILVLVGAATKKAGILNDDTATKINEVVFKVFLPCMLFSSFFKGESATTSGDFYLYCVAALAVFFVIVNVIALALSKEKTARAALAHGMFRGNTIIYGVPLASGILSESDVAKVVATLGLLVCVANLLGILCVELQLSKGFSFKSVLNIFKNPVIFSTLLGLAFKELGVVLPEVIMSPINTLGVCTTGAAFVVLGATFTLKSSLKNIRLIAWANIIRLVVMPAAILGVGMLCFGFKSPVEIVALLCATATPTAVSTAPIARSMGADGDLAGEIVLVSTAASIFTLFVFVFVLKSFGLL